MQVQAAIHGIKFDPDWLMGFEDMVIFHTYLPGQNSRRFFPAMASQGRHYHTVAEGKPQSDPEKLAEFAASLEKDDYIRAQKGNTVIQGKFVAWLKAQEGESPLGISRVADPPYFMDPTIHTKEEFQAHMEKMDRVVESIMVQDELISLAQAGIRPLKSQMENERVIEEGILTRWSETSPARQKEWSARIRAERNDPSELAAERSAKLALNTNYRTGKPVRSFGTHEHGVTEQFWDGVPCEAIAGNNLLLFWPGK